MCSTTFVVVADYQNDVIPVEDSHHLKPDVGLVRVWWDRAQKGQVDALQGRTRAKHRLVWVICQGASGGPGRAENTRPKRQSNNFGLSWGLHTFSWFLRSFLLAEKKTLATISCFAVVYPVHGREGFCFVARKCLVKKTLSRNELSKIFSANIAFALCLFALSKNITELWASQRKQIAFRAW